MSAKKSPLPKHIALNVSVSSHLPKPLESAELSVSSKLPQSSRLSTLSHSCTLSNSSTSSKLSEVSDVSNVSDFTLIKKTYFAKGKRGVAYTAVLRSSTAEKSKKRNAGAAAGRAASVSAAWNGQVVLVKEWNPSSAVDTIAHEAEMLKAVNTRKVGPVFIALRDGMLIREFIDGPEFLDWMTTASERKVRSALLSILAQCRALDELGINKLEMNHPHKHVLMRKDLPVFIDFDRSRYTNKPKNVTQVCQWFTSGDLSLLLGQKGINLSREALLSHTKHYKCEYSKLAYERIREVIQYA